MKNILIFFVILFAAFNIASAQVAETDTYTLNKDNTADTITKARNGESIGNFTGWFLEVYNPTTDSNRTFSVLTTSKISPDTTINVSMTRIDSANSTTLAVFGSQILTPGQRKLFKMGADVFSTFVISGEGRPSVKFRFYAMRRTQF